MIESISCSASISGKPINEDSHLCTNNGYLKIMAVADGLGSYTYPQTASSEIVKYLSDHRNNIIDDDDAMPNLFEAMRDCLSTIAEERYSNESKDKLLGTTLILCLETKDKVVFAYIGNGAILHINPTFLEFNDKDDPWFVNNLLNPHTVPQNGKEAMYKLLSNDRNVDITPSIITINKNKEKGDIFIICTDGIFSQDQAELFKHPTVGLLYKYNDNILNLSKMLKDYIVKGEITEEKLEAKTNTFLESYKKSFTDDATLGILITSDFIKAYKPCEQNENP